MAFTRLTAIYLLFSAALAAQSFAGIAVNAVNGQPLAGVHLKLFTLSIGGGIGDAYGAISSSDGRFSIASIQPGTYVLLTERTGFVQMMAPSGAIPLPNITLKPGDRIADYKLEMTPRAVVNVRVVDEYGDPVPNITVDASPVTPGSPVAATFIGNQSSTTNVLGEARINGGPGKFYIKASPYSSPIQSSEIRTDGTSDAPYGTTWYPSAAAVGTAAPVEIAAGARTAIEIRLIRQRGVTISGAVSGIPQDTNATIVVSSGDRPERRTSTRTYPVGPGGRFNLSRLPPAYYRVTAVTGGRPNLQSQPIEFTPGSADALDLQLALAPGGELSGSIHVAGDPPGAPAEKRTVTLAPHDGMALSLTGSTEPDGSFKVSGIFPNHYRIDVNPLPENGYVQTVDLNGAAASPTDLDFSRGVQGSRLRITLGRDAAQISGTVLDKDGQPVGTTPAIVVLTAEREHIIPNQDGIVKEGGKYSFKNIRPGKYWLFAIDAFRSGPSNNEEDFKRLGAAAEEIEIKPGDKITKDIKVLLKEDVDARNKK